MATAAWVTVLFATPVTINDDGEHVVWMHLPQGGYCGTNPGITQGQTSLGGLMATPTGVPPGVFAVNPASAGTQPANNFQQSYYWVDPLVSGGT